MQMCEGKARRIVDVGANMGIMSDRYAKWAGQVESFEPIHSLCRPGWHNVALSNTTGTMPFFQCDDLALSRLQLKPTTQVNGTMIDVEVRTLDSFGWTDVDAIKIDVEGFELEVLQGAIETIRASHPVIQAELMKQSRMIKKNQQVVELLLGLGYRTFDYKHLPLGDKWFHRPKDSDWFFKA
jgi:FkbM family methyltransferase